VSISEDLPTFRMSLLSSFQSLRVEEHIVVSKRRNTTKVQATGVMNQGLPCNLRPFHFYDEIFKASLVSSNVLCAIDLSFLHFSISDSLHSLVAFCSLVPD